MKLTLMIMVLTLNSAIVWANSSSCSQALVGSSRAKENPIATVDQPKLDGEVGYVTGLFEEAIYPSQCILNPNSLTVQETAVRSLELIRKGTDEDRLRIALALNNARNIGLVIKDRSKMPDEVTIGIKIEASLTPKEVMDMQLAVAKDQISHQRSTSSRQLMSLSNLESRKSTLFDIEYRSKSKVIDPKIGENISRSMSER